MSEDVKPLVRDNVYDLDEYRKRRVEDGTWPPSGQDQKEFFRRWKESQNKE